MPRVFVEPIGLTLEVDEQETLLDGLVRASVDIPTDCAGRGTCGKCLVRLGSGELTAPTERELKRIPEKLRAEGWRLACQAYPRSARVSIEVRGTAGQRRILTTSKLRHGAAHPAVTHAGGRAGAADARRRALRPGALRRGPRRRRGAAPGPRVPARRRCATGKLAGRSPRCTASASIDVHAGDHHAPELYGVAVDIGTSKVIAYLFDLHARRAHRPGGRREPADALRRGRHQRASRTRRSTTTRPPWPRPCAKASTRTWRLLYERQGIHPNHVCDMTVVGNTAMHHLALGLSPVGLGAGAVRAGRGRAAHAARE